MSRPIDADALLAEYDRVHVGSPGGARKLIEDAPTIEPKPHWIPCSDDMPTEFGNYLITEMPIGDFEIEPYVATYDPEDDEWTTGSPIKIVRRPVIAWMPLPKPYKENEDGD